MLRGLCGSSECTADCNHCDYPVAYEEEDDDLNGGIFEEWEKAGGIYAIASQLVRAELKISRGVAPVKNETPPAETP